MRDTHQANVEPWLRGAHTEVDAGRLEAMHPGVERGCCTGSSPFFWSWETVERLSSCASADGLRTC